MPRKILFVAMQMSTHTARWINQISDQGWEVHLFPVNYLPIHPELTNVTIHQPWFVFRPRLILKKFVSHPKSLLRALPNLESELHPNKLPVKSIYPLPVPSRMIPYLNGIKRVSLGESGATAPAAYGPKVLAKLIRKLKPDLIHSLEFQHCGYSVLKAKDILGSDFPKWIATNWGSDIYYFRQFENHRKQISRLLKESDFYSCECHRDVALAKELGFSGKVMPVMPNTGGIDIKKAGRLRNVFLTSQRKIVMVKGYQHFAGRALTALDAIEQCSSILKEYQILVFSASPEVHGRVDELRDFVGLNIKILPHGSHDFMLRMFSRARIYIGISVSDAISTSMLESIAMGAFPIQTNTSCCDEWIEDGASGFIVPPDDVEVISDRLRKALSDDHLVDRASELNWYTIQEKLDHLVLKQKAIAFYDDIFRSIPKITT
jgi:glycosyltransferase involved in cell wall biosynthesis